jgi:hypothetical protein
MDYIDTLLIMEDDLDETEGDDDLGDFGESSMTENDNNDPPEKNPGKQQTTHQTGVFVADVDQCHRK